MTRRTERIGEQLRGEVARILREEVADPRVGLVTLTRVDVSRDLARADVFWSSVGRREEPPEAELSEIAKGLESAAGFVRARLARSLDLRRTPRLHFVHDPSLELGSRTLALLRELSDGSTEA